MLSANLWADSYKYKICSSIDATKMPVYDVKYLEECVAKYLNQGYRLWGDPFVDDDVIYQALLGTS